MSALQHQGAATRSQELAFYDLLATRRSIRRYSKRPVSRELVDSLLQAAVTAPSAHNRQPWRFLVIECDKDKQTLARAMGERLRADRTRDGDPSDAIEADVARSYARLTGATVVILICISMDDMDQYPDEKRSRAEHMMAAQGTAMATQNLLLAAHASGLGACWMCAPLFCAETVSSALELADDWEPQAIVTLGYPADQGKPFRRRPLAELVRYPDGES